MHPTILYDGTCPLCHWAVIYLLRMDKDQSLRYAPIESDYSQQLLGESYSILLAADTLGFYTGQKLLTEADAVIGALRVTAKGRWLGSFLGLFPRIVRNWAYRMIANNRKRLPMACPVIPTEYRHLFLQ